MFKLKHKPEYKTKHKTSSSSHFFSLNIGRRCIFLLIVIAVIISGCESVQIDGFSVGATYLSANVETNSVTSLDGLGQMTTKENTKVDGVMPIVLLNFKFK